MKHWGVVIAIAAGTSLTARAETLSIELSPGRTTQATLKLPTNPKPDEKFPVLLIFGGFESAAHVLELVHPSTRVALASFDYPFSAPRKLEFPKSLRLLPQAKKLHPMTVTGIKNLVHALKNRSDIDASQISILGASFGSPFAIAAAAETPEISRIVIVHGFGRIPETAEQMLRRRLNPVTSWLLSRLLWFYVDAGAPETSARLLKAHQKILMITAQDDQFVPKESSDSLWNAIRESQAASERILMPGGHLMPGSERLIADLVRKVEDWTRGGTPHGRGNQL